MDSQNLELAQGNGTRREASDPPTSPAASPKRTRTTVQEDDGGSNIKVQMHKVDICWQLNFASNFPNFPIFGVNASAGTLRRFASDCVAEKEFHVNGLTDSGSSKDITCKMQVVADSILDRGVFGLYIEAVLSLDLEGVFFSDGARYNGQVGLTVHVVDEHGKVLFNGGTTYAPKIKDACEGGYDMVQFCRRLPPLQTLWDKRNTYFPDGVLRVKYKLLFSRNDPAQDLACLLKPMGSLSHDLGKLFRDGLDTDFVIKCGDTEFAAHQLILRARSPVFANMLSVDMKERAEGNVEVEDVEPGVMKAVLEYVYSSTIQPELYEAERLIGIAMAADKYQLTQLKDTCLRYMVDVVHCTWYIVHMHNMEPAVLGQLAGLVHLVSDAGRRDQVLKYCADNFRSLSKTEGFVAAVVKIPTNLLQQLEFVTQYCRSSHGASRVSMY